MMVASSRRSGRSRYLVMAAGGTGGHVFPAQALAEEMLERGWRVSLWTDQRGSRFVSSFPEQVDIRTVSGGTAFRGNLLARASAPVKVSAATLAAAARLRSDRPSVVVGFGGYVAFPPVVAAWLTGIPRMIHEQNSVLGRANRLLARRVDLLTYGISTTSCPDGVLARHIGNPVRSDFVAADRPYRFPARGRINVLSLGGSQGARIMGQFIPPALVSLPEGLRDRVAIFQQAREEDVEKVRSQYQQAGIKSEIRPFFGNVAQLMADAHLVIARAGASTLAEINAVGRPSILLPYAAAANDHQTANVRESVQAGAAVVIDERSISKERLSSEMKRILTSPAVAAEMAAAASRISPPHPEIALADAVERLVVARKGAA